MPAGTDGLLGRAEAMRALPPHELLDDPVLERMKRDHDQAAIRAQHFDRLGQGLGQDGEFIVHRDAQRLKCPRRRMRSAPAPTADRLLDEIGEVFCRLDRVFLPAFHDRASDTPRLPFLPESPQDICEVRFVEGGNQTARRTSRFRVETHVQRAVGLKREPPLLGVQLKR
jgi:hypothetical protein